MAELFLIRTKKNQIWGPISKEILAERVLKGELDSQDEICRSGDYWIFLHESEEVMKFLGVLPPMKKKQKLVDDEDTETDTQTQTETVSTDHVVSTSTSGSKSDVSETDQPRPYYDETSYRLEQPKLFRLIAIVLFVAILFTLYRVYSFSGR